MESRENVADRVKEVLRLLETTQVPLKTCLSYLYEISKHEELTKKIEDENDLIDRWVLRKKLASYSRLKKRQTVTSEYIKPAGGRFAVVTMTAEPADHFQYESKAKWPDGHGEVYEEAIIDAIIEKIFPPTYSRIMGVKFILEEIVFHDVDSTRSSFYLAAKNAVEDLLGLY